MDEHSPERSRPFAALVEAVAAWREGNASALERWIGEELDAAGYPLRLPLREWAPALGAIAEAAKARPGWPAAVDERATDFVRMLLRFSRPDGTTATLDGHPSQPRGFWKGVAAAFPAGDVGRVLDWWFPGRDVEYVPPPLPAWSAADRVLGVLRADWTKRGDLLAFDQREGASTRIELFGSGRTWLGPGWSTTVDQAAGPARVTAWGTSPNADVAEWSFGPSDREVTRLALMLRGRRLALLADLPRSGDATMQLDVAAGLTREPLTVPGAFTFRPDKPGKSAQAILLTAGEAGFEEESRRLTFRAAAGARWLPVLVSWDHARHRKPLTWVELTIAEEGKRCPAGAAWAVRASWGRNETFVFYRSLGPPARRSFLGCSTTARLLVGRFTPEGDVEPIVTLP